MSFGQDLRFGMRTLAQRPGFAAVAVATLALGIGANSAVFSVADAVLLRDPPFARPERIVLVWQGSPSAGYAQLPVSYPNFADLREYSRAFESIAAWNSSPETTLPMTGAGEPGQVRYAAVSPALLDVLGVAPALGRNFLAEEGREGDRVVLLTDAFWRRVFNGDPRAIGASIRLGGASWTVVGVLPADLRFVTWPDDPEIWLPLRSDPSLPVGNRSPLWARGAAFLGVVARLRDGITIADADADVREVGRRIVEENPGTNPDRTFDVVPLREQLAGNARPTLLLLLAAVGLVLLIACANVASLLLARGLSRRHEIAVRFALGASRRRVLRQLLTESLLLAFAGGALGVLLAIWAVEAVALHPLSAADPFVPFAIDPATVGVDARVLGFTVALTMFTAALAGVLPAVRASRTPPFGALRDQRAGGSHDATRIRDALVAAEVALATLLLVDAGLLVSSLVRLQRVDPGFDAAGVIAMDIDLPSSKYGDAVRVDAFYGELLARAAAIPGVQAAGAIEKLPLTGPQQSTDFRIAGEVPPEPGTRPNLEYASITPGALAALDVDLLAGRFFTGVDDARSAPVAVINRTAAQRFFPGESPLGRRIALSVEALRFTAEGPPTLHFESAYRVVVGVVADVKYDGLAHDARPALYIPFGQRPQADMSLVARTSGRPAGLAASLRAIIHAIDPEQPASDVVLLESIVARALAAPVFRTTLLGVFAALSALLACIGLYGLLAFTVSRRARELGVRIALGATARDIIAVVAARALRITVVGIVLGLAAAVVLTRSLRSLLFGVQPLDPFSFAVSAVALCALSLVAAALPGRRASRTDPAAVLRSD
jgi:putative ABC transport system permease protein